MAVIRNVSTVGAATLVSRALALVRDIGVAAVLGAGALSDAYFVALQIPNLFRRQVAEGGVNGAFVPIWLRLREGGGAPAFGASTLGIAIVGLGAFALLAIAFAPFIIGLIAPGFAGGERFDVAVEFLRLSVVYVVIAGVVAIAGAILTAEGRVSAAAGSIVVFNVVLVVAVLIVAALELGETQRSGEVLAVSFVVAGIAQLALVSVSLRKLAQHPRQVTWTPSQEARTFVSRALPALISGGIPQLALIIGTIIASSSVAAVSWLTYAYRLYELPLGVISIALAGVLAPRIAASVQGGTLAATRKAQAQALELALGLALPAAVGLATLSLPISGLLFERGSFGTDDTLAVAAALAVFVIGLPGHAFEKALAAVSFAHEDTRVPMQAALAGLAVAAMLALLLTWPMGHIGIAAGIACAGWVSSAWLLHVLRKSDRLTIEPDTLTRLARIGIATAVMAVALAVLLGLTAVTLGQPESVLGRIVTLAVLIGAAIAVYAAALQRLGVVKVRELTAAMGLGA